MGQKVDVVNQVGDDVLLELVHDVVHRFRAVLQSSIADDESGLAMMEVRALAYLARHDGGTSGELVKRSGRDKGQVARLVGGLVERGLVERAPGSDRRSHTLHLTPEGKTVQRRLERKRVRAAGAMFAPFSTAERSTLAELLGRLAPRE